MAFGDHRKVTEKYARVFLQFTEDPVEDIRRCVFYNIAEYPELFTDFKAAFKAAANKAQNDDIVIVKEEATRAFAALTNG